MTSTRQLIYNVYYTSEVEIKFAQTHTSVEEGAGISLAFDEFGRNAAIPLKQSRLD